MCPQVSDKSGYQRKLWNGLRPGLSREPLVNGQRPTEPERPLAFSAPPLRCFTILSRRLFRKTRYVTYWNHHEVTLEADQAGCLYSEADAAKIARYAQAQYGGRWILEAHNIDVQPVIGAF